MGQRLTLAVQGKMDVVKINGYDDDDDDDDEEQEHFSMNKSNEPSQRGTQTLNTSTLPSDDDEETTINDRNQWAHDSTVK